MGRHTENHRFLKTILVLDEHMNVIERHEVDESGRLITDPSVEAARSRNLRKKPSMRLARKTEPEASMSLPQPTVVIQPRDDSDFCSPVFSTNQIICAPDLDTDLILCDFEGTPLEPVQSSNIPIVW